MLLLENNDKGYSSAVEHLVYTCANALKKKLSDYTIHKKTHFMKYFVLLL